MRYTKRIILSAIIAFLIISPIRASATSTYTD